MRDGYGLCHWIVPLMEFLSTATDLCFSISDCRAVDMEKLDTLISLS